MSPTQSNKALTSGETKLFGVFKSTEMALGHRAMFGDLCLRVPNRVWTDSKATMSICARQGLGKFMHIPVGTAADA